MDLEQLIESIASAMSGIPGELVAFIISLCPILELRGGLIAASMFGVDRLLFQFVLSETSFRFRLFCCLLKKYSRGSRIRALSSSSISWKKRRKRTRIKL